MRPRISHIDSAREFPIPEGCFILEMTSPSDDPALSIARARVPAGVTTEWHALRGVSERYLIISGRGRVEVAGLPPTDVAAGDVVLIPPGTPQRITNVGGEDLLFHCVCMPRFTSECYSAVPPP